MSVITVDALRPALEGVIASIMATCDPNGVPNVSMISQVHYVDPERVALSYQFFNKTRSNLLATRRAAVQVTDPETLAHYRLDLEYEETRTSGALFESMKAKLAGIASHHGMAGVFRLLGSDVFRVTRIRQVPGPVMTPPPRESLLAATRRTFATLDQCQDLEDLFDQVTICLERDFGIRWAIVLVAEGQGGPFYAVASNGYAASGIGAEVGSGEGVIGVAAAVGMPIRIGHMTTEYRYGEAVREAARINGIVGDEPCRIAFPGLAAPRSQIALPIVDDNRVVAVLFAEDDAIMRFGYEEEDALALVAGHLGARMALLRLTEDQEALEKLPDPDPAEGTVRIRYFAVDQSVFLGHDYLIKGVAGAILWRLLREHRDTGRTEFTTRELRLDPALRLPAHAENLDARLILLRKRLEERCACLRIEKAGRGRFRLLTGSRIVLEEAPGSA
ncbi:GAF domain-containing protein [Ruegeria marina]|uniref:GAF domain-containing protein n=1 Tax=Ruegeria marina TaxID=639004 RepID=A0A1G6VWT0_9RHOB|nr:GAF domain-containing protein [Ruegeria marina]SDD58049.1 GAF domain-containing protein [Ruegeria marina]